MGRQRARDAKGDGGAAVAATLTKMTAPVKQPLSAALAQGTRRLLSTEDVLDRARHRARVARPALLALLCRKDWMTSEAALFDDAAVLLRLHPSNGASRSLGG
jgi:hypothetical protein